MVNVKKIKNAPYNPRIMSRDAKKALIKSMEEFEDISGIVLNKRTGNIISGNHRWNSLEEKYGKQNLTLSPITDSIMSIESDSGPTGFIMKLVDWDLEKEKAANIAANSQFLAGEFTASLQDILSELHEGITDTLFDDLRFDDLAIDLSDIDMGLDDSEETKEKIVKEARKRNDDLMSASGEEIGEVKIILTTVKISIPGEIEQEFREDLKKFIAKRYYASDVKVL